MDDTGIPKTVDELSAEWVTNSLRETGVLCDARVNKIEHQILGEGEGFMGQVIRLRLHLDQPEDGVPQTVIAKLPTLVRENRSIGELLGAYEREILFYDALAPALPLRTPRVYYSAMEGSRTSEQEAEGAAKLDTFPMWLIRLVMLLVTWLASRRTRSYVILLEDIAPGRVGDQVAGCTTQEAGRILAEIAKVHARYWEKPELGESYWLRRQVLNPRTMHSVFLKNLPGFSERFRSSAPEGFESSLRWLEENAVKLMRAFGDSAPETLLHGDLRLDNLGFSQPANSEPGSIIFFDWQLAGRGPSAYDVAYFLSGALTPELAPEVSVELVRDYHAALVSEGIEDYSFEDCLRDYRRALLSVLHRISSTDTMDLGDGRGSELIGIWLERTLARLHGVDYASLLPRASS
ncbi:MAG: phosphotransferase [Deltaproteobacteria bacterium]|nr:phosphotransferase [Deltaproteobacteria bacterium]